MRNCSNFFMQTTHLLGKPVSEKKYNILSRKIEELSKKNVIPKLSAILIGENPASKIYVNTKKKMFIKMQCDSEVHYLSKDTNEIQLLDLINKLNNDNSIHGILLQLPLPSHLDSDKILSFINPKKDVDGFHPENLGYLLQGNPRFIPCTPFGCIKILKYYKIDVKSKHIVIIGRSNIVGKPLMALLSQKFELGNATVTICHSYTKNLSKYTMMADIIIAATGIPNLLNADMIKKGAIIIDVGINRINDNSKKGYHIVGDVNYESVKGKAAAITPVPGGVGPMTITMLLFNTVLSAENSLI